MRFVIYGAGAIGGVLGARLYEAGADVTLIARGRHLERMREDGLSLRDPSGERRLRVRAVGSAGDAGLDHPRTVVVLAVKSQHTAQVLDALRMVAGPNTAILCAQNGIDNERQALRHFSNVYGAYVSCLATHLEPAVVQAHSSPVTGVIDVGRYPVASDDRAEELAACLRACGFDSIARPDIMAWKRAKLLVNLATTVEALCGPDAREGRLAAMVRDEGRAVFTAASLAVPSATELASRQPAGQITLPREGGSSWQSLSRGTGSVESDFLNGEIALLGRLHAVPTPANELVQRESTRLAAKGSPPGPVREEHLLAQLAASGH